MNADCETFRPVPYKDNIQYIDLYYSYRDTL